MVLGKHHPSSGQGLAIKDLNKIDNKNWEKMSDNVGCTVKHTYSFTPPKAPLRKVLLISLDRNGAGAER